jgi:hypothetical protein
MAYNGCHLEKTHCTGFVPQSSVWCGCIGEYIFATLPMFHAICNLLEYIPLLAVWEAIATWMAPSVDVMCMTQTRISSRTVCSSLGTPARRQNGDSTALRASAGCRVVSCIAYTGTSCCPRIWGNWNSGSLLRLLKTLASCRVLLLPCRSRDRILEGWLSRVLRRQKHPAPVSHELKGILCVPVSPATGSSAWCPRDAPSSTLHIRYWRCPVSPATSRRPIYLSRPEFCNPVVFQLELPRTDHSSPNLPLFPSTLREIPGLGSSWEKLSAATPLTTTVAVFHGHSLQICGCSLLVTTNNYKTLTILHNLQITIVYSKFLS